MPNGNELYNLGGGQITPSSQQRTILPLGEATRRRQGITGREVSGTTPMGGQGQGQKQGGLVNILDLMKGILGVPLGLLGRLFGGGKDNKKQPRRALPVPSSQFQNRTYGPTSQRMTRG